MSKELKLMAINKTLGNKGVETILIDKRVIKDNAIALYKLLKNIEGDMK
jgi:hypothetical protein